MSDTEARDQLAQIISDAENCTDEEGSWALPEDVALTGVMVALWGVWMVGGVWWPLGLVLLGAGVSGAVVGLIAGRRRR